MLVKWRWILACGSAEHALRFKKRSEERDMFTTYVSEPH